MSHPFLTRPQQFRRRSTRSRSLHAQLLAFLEQYQPSVSESTYLHATAILNRMDKFLTNKKPTTDNLFRWFRHRLTHDKVSSGTLAEDRKYVDKFFKWCVAMDYADRNPCDPIPRVPVRVVRRPVITDEQYLSLCKAADGTFWAPVLPLAWFTGARISDLCSLKWDNIDWTTGTLTFTPIKTRRLGVVVQLRLNAELMALLTERRVLFEGFTSPYIFPTARQLWLRGRGDIQKHFRLVRAQAGLPSTITFHCFRHTRASRMLNSENRVDPLTAADVLGLTSLETLRKYNHSSLAMKEKATAL